MAAKRVSGSVGSDGAVAIANSGGSNGNGAAFAAMVQKMTRKSPGGHRGVYSTIKWSGVG